jgi:hypothetical protein
VTDNFPRFYILNNRVPFAVDMMTWAMWLENIDNRRVAYTVIDVDLGVEVSTVFLGLDHNFSGGEPVLFETMVFGDVGDRRDEIEMDRYCTWAEAERGHAEIVANMTALLERAKAMANTTVKHE